MGYDTLVKVEDSKAKGKRYTAIFRDSKSGREKRVNFGDASMENFTIHKDPERRKRYLDRHKSRENWNDPVSPGALSRWILWGDSSSFAKSVSDYRKRFKLKSGRSMKSPCAKMNMSPRRRSPRRGSPQRLENPGDMAMAYRGARGMRTSASPLRLASPKTPKGKVRKVSKEKESGLPKKYVPKGLSPSDKKKQIKSIKEGKDRPKVKFENKRSSYVVKFEKKYGKKITDKKWISQNVLKMAGINKILAKGRGAYYSGGSRPNQTKDSWAYARLASVIVGGKARQVDKDIWDEYKI
jgi:hypothetical protein